MVRIMKYLIWALAIVYLLLPWDILPDLFSFWGRLDDLIVLYLAWRYYRGLFGGGNKTGQAPPGQDRARQPGTHTRPDTRDSRPKTPWEVLGLSPGASSLQIKEAYRNLAAQYHPDKVAHLGEEFQKLAEERFKEIQAAYNALKKEGGA